MTQGSFAKSRTNVQLVRNPTRVIQCNIYVYLHVGLVFEFEMSVMNCKIECEGWNLKDKNEKDRYDLVCAKLQSD
jgi:hypothetical protein